MFPLLEQAPPMRRWRRMLRATRNLAVTLVDPLVRLAAFPRPRRGIAVLLAHGVGDLLIHTEAYRRLREHYLDQPFLLVCSEDGRAYTETYLKPEQIIAIDRSRMRRDLPYRIGVLWRFARAGIRVVLQPHYNRDHLIVDALIRVSGAQERIGSSGTPMFITPHERSRGDRWYTRLIEEPPGPMHDAARNGAFVAALTGRPPARVMPVLTPPARHRAAPNGDYVVVAYEASALVKSWPAERFLDAAVAIGARTGLPVVLVGETKLPRQAAHAALVDLCGGTDLGELIALLGNARLVLANDSAPAHLAAALSVPAVAIGGGGIPHRYLPYPDGAPAGRPRLLAVDPPWPCFGCGWQCRYALPPDTPAPCMTAVTIEQAVAACLSMLSVATDDAALTRAAV